MTQSGYEAVNLELKQREIEALEQIAETIQEMVRQFARLQIHTEAIAGHFIPPERTFTDVIIPYDQ